MAADSFLSAPEQPGVLCLVPHGGDVGAKRCTSCIVETGSQRALGGCFDLRLKRDDHTLAIGLSEGNKADAG